MPKRRGAAARKKSGDLYKGQGTFVIPKLPKYIPAFFEYLGNTFNESYEDMLHVFEDNWESFQATGKPRKKRAPKAKTTKETTTSDLATSSTMVGGGEEDVVDKLKHAAVVSKILEANREQVESGASLMSYARDRNSKVDNAYNDLIDALDQGNKTGAVDYANELYGYAKVPETELDIYQEQSTL